MKIKIKNLFIFSFVACCLLLIATKTDAASLFFEAKNQEFTQGDEFLVNVFLNTEGESVNAVEGKLIFPENLLELKEIRDGNSIVNFWIDPVRTEISNGVEHPGTIIFSGITPGGFQEAKGFIFYAVFQARISGTGTIKVLDSKILLNDGRGTEANVKISPFQFFILEKGQIVQSVIQPAEDTDPPEHFNPEIVQIPNMFNGQWFLVFATQDKGSGIDHYEACEGSKTKCVVAESPYALKDQKLRSYIYIRAVDKAGNKRIERLLPMYPLKWYEIWWIWGIIILGVLSAIVVGYLIRKFLWQKFIKSH